MSDKLSMRYSIYLLEGRSSNISSIVDSMFINPSSLSKSGYLTKVCPTILFKQLYNTSLAEASSIKLFSKAFSILSLHHFFISILSDITNKKDPYKRLIIFLLRYSLYFCSLGALGVTAF